MYFPRADMTTRRPQEHAGSKMLYLAGLWLLLAYMTAAQVTLTGTNSASSTGADYPTGTSLTYASYASISTQTASTDFGTLFTDTSTMVSNATGKDSSSTASSTRTLLFGSGASTTSKASNGTSHSNSSATSTSALPTNTQPCNGYPEFCSRKFSNITYVAAHNSPFIRPDSVASNQELQVTTQLEDGIRMLQFQTHLVNGTIYLCHTSCDILNAGTLEAYLIKVVGWLQRNPYEVITILMGNSDVIDPQNYTAPVTTSGLINYVYTTPEIPMPLEAWPTLSQMILTNQRAVVMLDYQANQTAIPWLLDEFSQMWETPFSPTDRAFPCTAQRPPDRPNSVRKDRMYMANHNLNVQIAVAGVSLDVPAYTLLNETNGVTGFGSLGVAAHNCTTMWNRPPNYLLVDYYNRGSFEGSVFQVAAAANNVTYQKSSCCGKDGTTSAGVVSRRQSALAVFLLAVITAFYLA